MSLTRYPFSILLPLIILLGISRVAFGAASWGPALENPEYPGMCWVPDQGKAYSPGASWPMRATCGESTCESYRNDLVVSSYTCGVVGIPDGCRKVIDDWKPYPECCPYYKCD